MAATALTLGVTAAVAVALGVVGQVALVNGVEIGDTKLFEGIVASSEQAAVQADPQKLGAPTGYGTR